MALKTPEKATNSAVFGKKDPKVDDFDQKEPESLHLAAIEVSAELAMLYDSAKGLLDSVLIDSGVPANQKAQVLNAAASTLQQIAKTRTDLFYSERIRRIEQVLIRTLRDFPELQTSFVAAYEKGLVDELG